MKTKRTSFLSLSILLLTATLLTVGCDNRQPEAKQRVAINLPLSGPIAAFMAPYPEGLRFGVEDSVARHNLSSNLFEFDVQDNAGKPSQAVSVMQKQKLAGFQAYVSGSSEMSSAIISEIDQTKVPHLLIAFDAFMTGKGPDRLRILPHYKIEGPMWVQYAKLRGAKKVFALTLNNAPIEEEFVKIVEPGLRQLGAEFRREKFEWQGSDYRALALKAQEFQPDFIMVNGYSVHLYPAVSALRALGLVKQGNVLTALDFVDLLYNGTSRAELQDVAFITPLFEIPGGTPESAEWRKRYQTKFGKTPSYVAAYAYDTGRILTAAYAKEKKLTKQGILSVLPIQGVSGKIEIDSDGDLSSTLAFAIVKPDGSVEHIRAP